MTIESALQLCSAVFALLAAAAWLRAATVYVLPAKSTKSGAEISNAAILFEVRGKWADLTETIEAQSRWNSIAAMMAAVSAFMAFLAFWF